MEHGRKEGKEEKERREQQMARKGERLKKFSSY